MTSVDLRAREMEMTAELIRQRLRESTQLKPLDAGEALELGCTDERIWMETGGHKIAHFVWREWWERGLDTREDRAAKVARALLVEAGWRAADAPVSSTKPPPAP